MMGSLNFSFINLVTRLETKCTILFNFNCVIHHRKPRKNMRQKIISVSDVRKESPRGCADKSNYLKKLQNIYVSMNESILRCSPCSKR